MGQQTARKTGLDVTPAQLEALLRDTNQNWRALVQATPDIVAILERDGTIRFLNRTGPLRTPEQVVGTKVFEYLPSSRHDRIVEALNHIFERGEPLIYESSGTAEDGTISYFENRVSPLRDEQRVSAALFISTDITARKQAEQALQRALDETTHAQRTMQALCQATHGMQRARTPEEVYHIIADELGSLGYRAAILTLTEDREHLAIPYLNFEPGLLQAVEKLVGLSVQDYRIPLVPGGFFQQILADGDPTFLGAEQITELITEALPAPLRPLASQVVNLLRGEQGILARVTVGGLKYGLLTVHGTGLVETDVPAVSALASHAGLAIENARMGQQMSKHQRYLETLQRINSTLRSTLPLPEVLRTIAQNTCEALDYVGSVILLPDASGTGLLLVAAWGSRFGAAVSRFTRLGISAFRLPLTADTNPIVQAYLTGQLQVTRGEPERIVAGLKPTVPPKIARSIAKLMGAKRQACLPLSYAGQVKGVLMAFSPHEEFSDEERSILLTLADQAGLAIENARLFDELRSAHERLQSLSRRLVEVQEDERRQIARELHDQIGQMLTGLKIILELGARSPTAELQASLDEAGALVQQLMARVRDLSLELRPAMLDDLGLLPALLWHLQRYEALTHLEVSITHRGLEGRRFAPPAETAMYRIAQEALANVARHASVQKVTVTAWADQNWLILEIRDQGTGFDRDATLASGIAAGLIGMHERAALLGGHLVIESAPGEGTLVRATLPISATPAGAGEKAA